MRFGVRWAWVVVATALVCGVSPVMALVNTAPTVSAVKPVSGPTAGGTAVTVTGTNLTGATSVTFGGVAGTQVSVVSATTLTVVSPARAAGTVDVRVTTKSGTSAVVAADRDRRAHV